ncbi:hypothetical protein [Streptomyces litchfieldiae]|uniref:Uncharacterized protein n=1 Tax=Streptomyces litchfieldiae TaxID=3075543 RepID=A0ABU2MI09_9ACTN|nr:hypothetical protein [Streptomyces sp. DSM 44938]MDT0341053.1 hypothetical protein [Streptomyces sp. DSM 44938]
MTSRDDFRSNVTAPRSRPSLRGMIGGALVGLVVISGLIGALLLARPALDVEHRTTPDAPEAAQDR